MFETVRSWLADRWRPVVAISSAVLVLVATLFSVWFFLLATHKQGAEVSSFEWRRGIEVEDYQPRRLGKWIWDVPADAYDRYEHEEIHHYNSVYAGETCSTNGNTRSCTPIYISVPVYETFVDYTVDRWETIDWLVTTAIDHRPVWHGTEAEGFDETPVYGHRRVGDDRFEKYTVFFTTSNGKSYHTDTSLTQWSAVDTGEAVNLNLNRQDSIRSINWPVTQ